MSDGGDSTRTNTSRLYYMIDKAVTTITTGGREINTNTTNINASTTEIVMYMRAKRKGRNGGLR